MSQTSDTRRCSMMSWSVTQRYSCAPIWWSTPGAWCSRCWTLGPGMARQACLFIRLEVLVRATLMNSWRVTVDAGGAWTALTMENRHDPPACVVQMFGCDHGC